MGIWTGMGGGNGDKDRDGDGDADGGGEMGSRTETRTASCGFSAEFDVFRHAASLAASWVQAKKMGMFSQWPGWGGGSHQELGVSQLHRGRGLSPQAELRGAGGSPSTSCRQEAGGAHPSPAGGTARTGGWYSRAGTPGFCAKTWQDPGLELMGRGCRANPAPPDTEKSGIRGAQGRLL